MDVQQTYNRLTSASTVGLIRAGWVERYVASPISFWCSVHAPDERKDPINDFQQGLFDYGIEHQKIVAERSYPGSVQTLFLTEEEGFKNCLEFLAQGARSVQDMPLMDRPDGVQGRPDVLERVDGAPSDLGDYSYRVVEIKSARRIKDSHVLQGALYNRLLGRVQGLEPEEFHIVNRDFDVIPIRMADVGEKLDEALEGIRRVLDGHAVDACHGTGRWPWASYVDQLAIDSNDVSLISGVGGVRRGALITAGFDSVDDVACADPASLTDIKGVGPPTAEKFVSSAKAISQGIPVRRQETPELRPARTEVFFDFEGAEPEDPDGGLAMVNYLIGAVHRTGGREPEYACFFAESFEHEGPNLGSFLEWATSLEDPVFYHWHHFERNNLKKMVDRHAVDPALAQWVLDRMVDLFPWATDTFAFSCYGETLKEVAQSLGFSWRQDDVTGVGSMALYQRYVNSSGADEDSRRKITVYNEDDCNATMLIYDWVLGQDR